MAEPAPRQVHRQPGVLATATLALVALAVLGAFALVAARWDWVLTGQAWTNYLIPGVWDTLRAAGVAILLASVLALLLSMARMSDIAPLRWAATVFVEFFRAVPVLVMMLFTFFFLSIQQWTPASVNPFIAVIVGLTAYNSAVLCEVIRNGVASLPKGQREAGLSIGLTPSEVRRSILIPQALTAMMPTLISQVIVITKDSALGYLILYPELVTRARQLGSAQSATLPAYFVVAILFILINYAISKAAEYVESKQRRRSRSSAGVGPADTATVNMGMTPTVGPAMTQDESGLGGAD